MAVGIAAAPTAMAHDWLTSSDPGAGTTITTAPARIKLSFSDQVLTRPAQPDVVVTGPQGRHYETGCASALGRDVSVAWRPGAAGQYRVEWRIVSADGHPVSQGITFTYAGKNGGNAGRTSSPSCGSSPRTEGASTASGDNTPVYVALAAVVGTALAIAAMFARARRR